MLPGESGKACPALSHMPCAADMASCQWSHPSRLCSPSKPGLATRPHAVWTWPCARSRIQQHGWRVAGSLCLTESSRCTEGVRPAWQAVTHVSSSALRVHRHGRGVRAVLCTFGVAAVLGPLFGELKPHRVGLQLEAIGGGAAVAAACKVEGVNHPLHHTCNQGGEHGSRSAAEQGENEPSCSLPTRRACHVKDTCRTDQRLAGAQAENKACGRS